MKRILTMGLHQPSISVFALFELGESVSHRVHVYNRDTFLPKPSSFLKIKKSDTVVDEEKFS